MSTENPQETLPNEAEPSREDVVRELRERLAQEGGENLAEWIDELDPSHMSRAMTHLSVEEQHQLLNAIGPEAAADLIDDLPDEQSADLLELMDAGQAAAIVEELDSDDRADVLAEMEEDDAEAILDAMPAEEAEEARQLLSYDSDTAGGVMVKEYVAYRMGATVSEVLEDLRSNHDEYSYYDVRYFYVTDKKGVLRGVLRLRDLVLSSPLRPVKEIMIADPTQVRADVALITLQRLFETHSYSALPVTDNEGYLLGIVIEKEVAEAARKHASRTMLKLGGIFGGEELRSMPVLQRIQRRLTWLLLILLLTLVAASVIHLFQETLDEMIALAVFLPVVVGLSGSSGNQAMSLSLRELALGAVNPWDILYVLLKELKVGLINGGVLGVLLGIIGALYKDVQFGVIIGTALTVNTIIAVSLGGLLPLVIKRMGLDPAAAGGPILTTVVDSLGFFMVLGLASLFI